MVNSWLFNNCYLKKQNIVNRLSSFCHLILVIKKQFIPFDTHKHGCKCVFVSEFALQLHSRSFNMPVIIYNLNQLHFFTEQISAQPFSVVIDLHSLNQSLLTGLFHKEVQNIKLQHLFCQVYCEFKLLQTWLARGCHDGDHMIDKVLSSV